MRKQSTPKSKTNWGRLREMRDEDIDFRDIPEVDPQMIKKMEVRMPKPKELVSIRIDPDVLEWFRKQGRRYQTRMNAILRAYMEAHSR